MFVEVMLSTGESEEWFQASDAVVDPSGSLLILGEKAGENPTGDSKTVKLQEEIDRGPDLPPKFQDVEVYLWAMYAPAMWMRVSYNRVTD